VENEAWDGSITMTVKIVNVMKHDDTEYLVVQTPCIGQCVVLSRPSTAMQITAQSTHVRIVVAQYSPRAKQTPTGCPRSYTSPDPTLSSLLPRKKRSLRDIYNEDHQIHFHFFLFSHK
jgi:hypothetical protein